MPMDDKVKSLIEFCTKNVESSSPFLSPEIYHTISLSGLFDKIAEIWSIPKNEIGKVVDNCQGIN